MIRTVLLYGLQHALRWNLTEVKIALSYRIECGPDLLLRVFPWIKVFDYQGCLWQVVLPAQVQFDRMYVDRLTASDAVSRQLQLCRPSVRKILPSGNGRKSFTK